MNSSSNPEDKPKLFVDTDWKAKVEAERAALREQEARQARSEAKPTRRASGDPGRAEFGRAEPGAAGEPPPASFSILLSLLASQALHALGYMATPDADPPPPDLPLARHFIDLIGVLETKCAGNLTATEQALLAKAQHDLRMCFLDAQTRAT